MIENVFGIVNISKNYFLTLQQFEFAVKHILDTKYNIDPNFLEIRINYIQDETVLVFDSKKRNDIFKKIIDEDFSFRNEGKVKTVLISDIFSNKSVSEKVIYNKLSNSRVEGINFTVRDNEKYLYSDVQNMKILDCPQIQRINSQIEVLNEKKIEVIKNNKR